MNHKITVTVALDEDQTPEWLEDLLSKVSGSQIRYTTPKVPQRELRRRAEWHAVACRYGESIGLTADQCELVTGSNPRDIVRQTHTIAYGSPARYSAPECWTLLEPFLRPSEDVIA